MFNKINALILVFLFVVHGLYAAEKTIKLSPAEIEAYKTQCEQMVAYLTGTLNFLGNPDNPPSEKEIIINSSYLKIFRDDKVQIEGDLVQHRAVPLNKNVQAYMKDVVFFFKRVHFSVHINSIDPMVNPEGQIFFKVSLNRNLQGITVNNDTVDNNEQRYIEINLNAAKNELKIASIYTHIPNENSELQYWWNQLSTGWKNYFGQSIIVYDTLPFSHVISFTDTSLVTVRQVPVISIDTLSNPDSLKPMTETLSLDTTWVQDTLFRTVPDTINVDTRLLFQVLQYIRKIRTVNISGNLNINNLNPLSELPNLTYLNASHTLIDDLTPLRSLNRLENLNVSGCPVKNLEPLRYASSLHDIDASYTSIRKMEVLGDLKNLETINLSDTQIDSVKNLHNLSNLRTLELAGTPIHDIDSLVTLTKLVTLNLDQDHIENFTPLSFLSGLQNLDLDSTNIIDLNPLKNLNSLSVLRINNTGVNNLMPLAGLNNLKYIYCDNSGISSEEADEFTKKNPESQVIYNSQKLKSWWDHLSQVWKNVFKIYLPQKGAITKVELHRLMRLDTLNLANNKNIHTLSPLAILSQLRKLNLSGTSIRNLAPLTSMSGLRYLNISHTEVKNLQPLEKLRGLKQINLEYTAVKNLLPLENNSNLALVYADNTRVGNKEMLALKSELPQILVIYQTPWLRYWWNHLSKPWRSVFSKQAELSQTPTRKQLQKLVNLEKINIDNPGPLSSLGALKVFISLTWLSVNNSNLTNIMPLSVLKNITTLRFTNSPLSDISILSGFSGLKALNLKNTGIENLYPLQNLRHLQTLNLSGTRVKTLKPLQGIKSLQTLIINNTRIRKLKFIMGLPNLKLLRCDHTSISPKQVDQFKEKHPGTRVIFY